MKEAEEGVLAPLPGPFDLGTQPVFRLQELGCPRDRRQRKGKVKARVKDHDRMKRLIVFLAAILLATGLQQGDAADMSKGIFVSMETNKGRMLIQLHYTEAPLTVANFIALAEGRMEWQDPFSREQKRMPFYDGLMFHKVVPGGTIHGGDPKGTGQGGPGYLLDREINPALTHARPGILSMLNDGEYAHGSQFLITLGPADFLNGRHAVFGEVIDGLDVLRSLEQGDRILRVKIFIKGEKAEAFDANIFIEKIRERASEIEAEKKAGRVKGGSGTRKRTHRRDLPQLTGEIDPARVPQKDQPEVDKVALEYILITHRGALTPKEYQVYEKEEAEKVAEHLVQAGRMAGSDFANLAQRYSDSPDFRIRLLVKCEDHPENLGPVFRLKEDQVSDPIHTPKGYMILKRVRLDLIKVRHILVAYQGAGGSTQVRSKEEARELAETILKRAKAGEDFADLARAYSDSESAKKGGLIGEIAKGMTVPAFDHAAFRLKVNEISEVTPTPAGFQVIQRIE
jgi:cyclophilin family peptidyl-prolyl cis-trans isomerase